jgi:hypothetical protein
MGMCEQCQKKILRICNMRHLGWCLQITSTCIKLYTAKEGDHHFYIKNMFKHTKDLYVSIRYERSSPVEYLHIYEYLQLRQEV